MQPEADTPPDPSRPDRRPLDAARLTAALVRPGGLWRAVEVTDATGSTNADLLARVPGGAPEGLILVAEEQLAGRGRLGRTWVSPPRSALMFSVLLRPAPVPAGRRGWLTLLAGVAVATAVTQATGVAARLKWPNDLLAPAPGGTGPSATGTEGTGPGATQAKLAGILAEASGDAVVVGVGLNVSTTRAELPPPGPGALPATSLREATGKDHDREQLFITIAGSVEAWYHRWREAAGDPGTSGLLPAYTQLCATIGRQVRAELPGNQLVSGRAEGVDPDGRLLVRGPSGAVFPVAAGDIVHLR